MNSVIVIRIASSLTAAFTTMQYQQDWALFCVQIQKFKLSSSLVVMMSLSEEGAVKTDTIDFKGLFLSPKYCRN